VRFLTRFQRLERSRAAQAQARSATGERFEALEPAAPLPDAQPGSLDRFAPPAEAPPQLAEPSDAQPFVRCPACGVDSALGTRRCQCGRALDTLEVVAFNTELWDRHRAERAEEEERTRHTREAGIEEARRLHDQRQALGESIAREVAARERGFAVGVPARFGGALAALGVLAAVLLPHGPAGRFLLAAIGGALAVWGFVARSRSRAPGPRPDDQP